MVTRVVAAAATRAAAVEATRAAEEAATRVAEEAATASGPETGELVSKAKRIQGLVSGRFPVLCFLQAAAF